MNDSLQISDDSGFIGVVNNEMYDSFVLDDWKLDELLKRFSSQTNQKKCIVWSTGVQNLMHVKFSNQKSNYKAFREVSSQIKVTNRRLYLSNYEDLSMAAQFIDESIPPMYHADLYIELENGLYDINVKQLFDPNKFDDEVIPNPSFEVVLTKTELEKEFNFSNVIWWNEDQA